MRSRPDHRLSRPTKRKTCYQGFLQMELAGLEPATGASNPRPFVPIVTITTSGGGGNRTRVRNRTGQSIYKLRYPLNFARRPVGTDQPFGLVLL